MSELDRKLMQTPDLNKERLETLKNLFPDLFTVEGKLNPDELKKIIDPDLVKETERFEFKWFGKSEAKRNAFTPSKATFVYDDTRSVNPEYADRNMIIEGENLESLKCLLSAYREKVKCIYIDPPYNKDMDFVYSDRWDESKENYWEHIGVSQDGVFLDTNTNSSGRFHSNWLDMIYSRLLLARQLLQDDGVIFISIDDNEITHLKKLCDEVFGEDNFLTKIIVRATSRGQTYKQIAKTHEYILVYTKTPAAELYELEKNGESDDLNLSDDISKFNIRELRNRNPKFGKHNRPNLYYPIYVNKKVVDKDGFFPVALEKSDSYNHEVLPFNSEGIESCWRWGKDKFAKNNHQNTLKSNLIAKQKQDSSFGVYEKYRKTTYKPTSIWDDNKFLTETGTVELGELSLSEFFDFPKPVNLVRQCFLMASDDGDICLDFFGGSGTSGQAIFEINYERNEKRNLILIQIPEKISDTTDTGKKALKAGYKKISDITIERNKRVIQKIENELTTKNTKDTKKNELLFSENPEDSFRDVRAFRCSKPGFKVYKLTKSNFPRIEFAPDTGKTEEENLALLDKYIEEKEAMFFAIIDEKNIFDEVLLKNGFMLNYSKIQEVSFTKNKVYRIKDNFKECLISMDMSIDKQTLKELEAHKDTIFICLERSLDTTMKWNLKHLFGDKLIAF